MVTVFGWYDHSNVGDESYKIAFPQISALPFEFVNTLPKKTDTLILGGGDILSPVYLEQVSRLDCSNKLIISASATKKTPIDLIKQFKQVFVRDLFSVRLLQGQGVACSYMPDISFLLKPNRDNGRNYIERVFKEEKLDLRKKRIGVVINAYLADPGSDHSSARDFMVFHKFAYDLARMFDNMDASFVFFPMCTMMPADDRVTNGIVAYRCKFWNKNLVIHDRLGVQGTLDLISSMDFVVSSRLHSSIFSVISQVPFLDITHHDKAKHFLETVSLEDSGVSYWELTPGVMTDMVNRIMGRSHDSISVAYQKQMEILQREVKNVCLR